MRNFANVRFQLYCCRRYGEPLHMNNEDVLMKDLLSTKNKGVGEGEALQKALVPPDQVSARSSLRSLLLEAGGSVMAASVQDSGVYSHHAAGEVRLQQAADIIFIDTTSNKFLRF